MSSFVRLGPGKSGGPLGIKSEGLEHTILTPNMRSIRFKAGDIIRVGGQLDGNLVEDGEVPANARVIVKPATKLSPRKYETVISFNPAILKHGSVSCPAIVGPDRGEEIFLHFHAARKTDLNEFDYIFELFMID